MRKHCEATTAKLNELYKYYVVSQKRVVAPTILLTLVKLYAQNPINPMNEKSNFHQVLKRTYTVCTLTDCIVLCKMTYI